MKEICYFDKDGNLINIGVWNHKFEKPTHDEEEIETNPIPDGAYTEEKEIVINEDGSKSIKVE